MILQISASAGSGKTYALTRRFLDLLDGANIHARPLGCVLRGSHSTHAMQGILAATFTNKAAAEMKERVLGTLKERALAEGAGSGSHDKGHSEAWVDYILRHFGALNIRTIDSLLFTLVRLSALELSLPPDFTPSFNRADYFTPVYDGLMEDLSGRNTGRHSQGQNPAFAAGPVFFTADAAFLRARLAEACRSLLHHGDFVGFTPKQRLRDMCFELTELGLRGLRPPRTDTAALHARIQRLHKEAVAACQTLLGRLQDESLAVNAHYLNFLRACAACPVWQAMQPKSTQHAKSDLDACLNKASKNMASDTAHQAFASASAAIHAYATALPLFSQALQLAPLTALVDELLARMHAARRESGLLPAPLLPRLAVAALGQGQAVSDALCRLGSRLSHLLLDEFQDTSREQWHAILPLAEECLATGGSLTYVGDVKQAIYGWRGGDARLFDEPLTEPRLLGISQKRAENLPANWRSHPAVVSLNNAFFSLLAEKDVTEATLRAMLPEAIPSEFLAQAVKEASAYFSRTVQSIPAEKDWSLDPHAAHAGVRLYEVEAQSVGALQEAVRQRLRTLLFDELLPVWQYADIAILVRSGTEGALVAEWLAEWGLPVVTENSFLLATHPLVGSLIAFLTFLDYPLDDAAFMDCIRADFLRGLANAPDNDALDAWAALVTREFGKKRPPLYTLLRRDFPLLWAACFEAFHAQAGLMSAYDALSEAMERFGLFTRYPEQAPFLRRLLELAHLAESRGHSSLAAFLAFWREASDNEKLPLPENMDAIRIMTVHKAKGLEFNVVIVPFQHKAKRHTPPPVVALVHGTPLLTRALPELPDLYYPDCVINELERLCLQYVAWTRPVYALHAFLTRPVGKPTPLSRGLAVLSAAFAERHANSLCQWEFLGEGLKEAQDHEADEAEQDKDHAAQALSNSEALSGKTPKTAAAPFALPQPWRPMGWLPRLRIFRSPLEAARFSPRQRGILFHLCLEHLQLDDAAKREQDVARAVEQGLRLFPLALSEPDKVAQESYAALLWFAGLEHSALWLRHGLREQDIMDADGRMHRVDLLVDEAAYAKDGALLAVDYKSGSALHEQGDHREQVLRYMRLLHAATGRAVRGLLVYLDEKRLVHIPPLHDLSPGSTPGNKPGPLPAANTPFTAKGAS